MLTLLDFRPEKQNLVIITPTISMCQNCTISFLVDPWGAQTKFAHLAHPRYNYDVQSMQVTNLTNEAEALMEVVLR